jgi:hypothetical protein
MGLWVKSSKIIPTGSKVFISYNKNSLELI